MPDSENPAIAARWLRAILTVLYERRVVTRSEIAEATGLNSASVSQTLRFLLDRGTILKQGEVQSTGGRRSELLKLNSDAGYFVVLDLEGSRIRFGVTSLVGDVKYRWEEPLVFGEKLELQTLTDGINRSLESLSATDRSRVIALGVTYTGGMGKDGLIEAVNLGWDDYPLAEQMRTTSPLPVYMGHDCLTKLYAERWLGAAQGCNECVYVTVAMGVGMASLVNGQPLCGEDGLAGELGHNVIDPDAPEQCACGKRGCLEAMISSPNLVRQYYAKIGRDADHLRGEQVIEVFEKARSGDSAAVEVIDRACKYLGLALSHVVNVFDPELIIIGGDMIRASDLILPRIADRLDRYASKKALRRVKIRFSTLGYDAGLIGAASLAFHRSLEAPALLKKICSPILPERRKSESNSILETHIA